MHPLITAHDKLFRLLDLAIRMWSPYYPMWQRMIADQRELIGELEWKS